MIFGLMEGVIVAAGLAGGVAIGRRARQAAEDDDKAARRRAGEGGGSGGAGVDGLARTRGSTEGSSAVVGGATQTLTVMFVGDSASGKSLFCTRTASADGSVGRETLAKTYAPTWIRADVALSSTRRVAFQLLDTPGRAGLSSLCVPFYRQVDAVVLVFDVGSLGTFEALQTTWYAALEEHRLGSSRGHKPGSCVVLANVIDERRERQVKRSVAVAWCESVGLPYFETHPADGIVWRKMLATLWETVTGVGRGGDGRDELGAYEGFEALMRARKPRARG